MPTMPDIRARKTSKLDPNPRAKQQPKPADKAEKLPPTKPAPIKEAAVSKKGRPKKGKGLPNPDGGQYLSLGANYKIAHKPGSAYSIFYSVVAQQGHFEAITEAFEKEMYALSALKDPTTAKELLDKLLVPVEKLEGACRCHPIWKEHANKKTEKLKSLIKEGDEAAKGILSNESRAEAGAWTGNIPEMISTCVGYFNYLVESDPKVAKIIAAISKLAKRKKKDSKKDEPNKNVKKFEEAGVVFRRFPLNKNGDRSYVMMYPKKYMNQVKQAIQTVHNIDEDAQIISRLEAKLKELQKAKS